MNDFTITIIKSLIIINHYVYLTIMFLDFVSLTCTSTSLLQEDTIIKIITFRIPITISTGVVGYYSTGI